MSRDDLIAGDPVRSASSLERRLPLMISGLIAVTLIAFGFLAFTELRQSSVASAMAQVRTLLVTTRDNSVRVIAQRLVALEGAASHPMIARAATESSSGALMDTVRQTLRARVSPAESLTFVREVLVDVTGRRHTLVDRGRNASNTAIPDSVVRIPVAYDSTMNALSAIDAAMLDSTIMQVASRDSAKAGTVYLADSTLRYWSVAPVRSNRKIVGYLAEQRQLRGTGAVAQVLKDLTGQDLSVYYASVGTSQWATVQGVPISPRFDIKTTPDTFHVTTPDGERLLGAKTEIRGIPLAVVLAINETSVDQRANAFLRRMLMIGAALLAISMLGAWLVSRRVTTPLKSLTLGARQIARGNYGAREPVQTDDELGELAQAFNRMAQRIGESHSLLALRIEESEALAVQLHQASKAKSEFLAMMSHELRTPLSAIAGYAEILQMGMRGKLNEAQQLDLSRIQANQVHLLRIINDILDIAQVESGQMQVSARPVLMQEVMGDVEPIVLPLLAGRDVKYAVHEDVNSFVVLAERERLTQVLVNLIANAVRFTQSGGNISVHVEMRDGRVRIHVTDNGIGIAPDKLEAIFQPFVQAEGGASRRAQGTGLGLAISRRIAEAMGGTLTVKSGLGQGSTFTLELPGATADASQQSARQDTSSDGSREPGAHHAHVHT